MCSGGGELKSFSAHTDSVEWHFRAQLWMCGSVMPVGTYQLTDMTWLCICAVCAVSRMNASAHAKHIHRAYAVCMLDETWVKIFKFFSNFWCSRWLNILFGIFSMLWKLKNINCIDIYTRRTALTCIIVQLEWQTKTNVPLQPTQTRWTKNMSDECQADKKYNIKIDKQLY